MSESPLGQSSPQPLGQASWLHALPYEAAIGWRYTRAGRGAAQRRNGFVSFISAVSVLGIALGVAALIIVLSVMNGFQKEVRERMLSMVAHVELQALPGEAMASDGQDWQAIARKAQAALEPSSAAAGVPKEARVLGSAPFISSQALVSVGEQMKGIQLRGVDPSHEGSVTPLATREQGAYAALAPGAWQIVLGAELALQLGVRPGDKLTVVSPGLQLTPAGAVPRTRQFTVAGVFHANHYEYDSAMALVHIEDAARLLRTGGPTGVQLRLADAQAARAATQPLQKALGESVRVRDWTRSNASWFDAVQLEKRLMFIILSLIVAVAAFNLVSSLVMTVTDKRADIAILRTLGASPRSIMGIFMVQGATAGVLGTLAGVGLGLLVAHNIDVIVPAIERVLGVAFFPGSVYLISRMPSEPMAADVWPITLIALVLALLATLYPSWRASQTLPAAALRHD